MLRVGCVAARTLGFRLDLPPGIVKDALALTVMHCALFILIRPDMGRDLLRGKITASYLDNLRSGRILASLSYSLTWVAR